MKNIFEIKIKNSLDLFIDKDLENEIYSINNTLYLLLIDEKNKIDKYLNIWDKYKKFTNEYEYIYSSHDTKYKSILHLNKVSRSYFKLWEILKDFSLISENNEKIKIANIAEAPGGFIEAIVDYIYRSNNFIIKPSFYGLSLLDNSNKNIPSWKIKKQFQQKYNIYLNSEIDNAGNIYNYDNITKYISTVNPNSCHLITCDGGFDINGDYENQEKILNKLLLCETYLIIKLQKHTGNSIIKCFDLFTDESILIIYLLSLFYSSIYIIKPLSSRPANSEKYLLCQNFNEDNLLLHTTILESLKEYLYFNKEFNIVIPTYLKLLITEYNLYYTNRQIYYISNTINLIENIKKYNNEENILDNIYKTNIILCQNWCKKYNFI